MPSSWKRVRRCRTFWQWDDLVVVPRFGFASVDDYYRSQSVAGKLGALRIPSLVVYANEDPLVPLRVVEPYLPAVSGSGTAGNLTVRKTKRGGHLGFPRDLDLGLGGAPGLYAQLASYWQSLEGSR